MRYFFIALALFVVFAVPAFAADVDVTITIPSWCDWDVNDTTLDLDVVQSDIDEGESEHDPINVDVYCNDPDGWLISGLVTWDGSEGSFLKLWMDDPTLDIQVQTTSTGLYNGDGVETDVDLYFYVTQYAYADAGEYGATLTLTMAGK